MNVTISISTFKIGSVRAEREVSPDCRPPSIITAPKPGKILSEPCGTERKPHSSYMNFVHVYHSRSVKNSRRTAKNK